ncbi:MAG: DUF4350 domain-containing protein [Microthrixaceae bacterium]|nr:DUF4350 domain-containing protein [Microthrixaceae bacterium]MCO5318756.1 DUF4350 domain-containing protein [Microthrixaceae bacterium]
MRSRTPVWVGLLALLGVVALVLALGSRGAGEPFLIDSSSPDGYRAVSLVLADHGVVSTTVDQSVFDPEGSGVELAPSDAVVVPVAEWLEPEQLAALRALAERGATVVLAAQDGFSLIEHSVLTRTPAVPVRVGMCTVPALASLEAVDDVAHGSIDLVDGLEGLQRCFTGFDGPAGRAAVVTAEAVGSGRLVGLASPYVWANARLQPDKERGGEPLDNAAVAVGLLGGSGRVVFVRTAPGAGGSPDGTRNPLGLLPVNVELALVQLAAAFVVYAWWRGTRLGRPVAEKAVVDVAGSELVEAVGGLLRRHGSVPLAAGALREREVAELSRRLGIPPGAGQQAVASAVAARSSRSGAEVHSLLFGTPPDGPEGLVSLCGELDRLHSEVLDVQPTT